MEQRTDDWFEARMGKVTASKVADILAKTRSGPAASRKNYMMQLLCERLTGNREDSYQNAAMMRGTELEPFARIAYEAVQGETVEEVGFINHPEIVGFGASPDGLVGPNGLVEIKCPNTAQHVEFLRTGIIESRYDWQMRAQMACANRDWCDFASYDDRLPEHLQLKVVRVYREEEKELEMLEAINKFLFELSALESELKALAA